MSEGKKCGELNLQKLKGLNNQAVTKIAQEAIQLCKP